MKHVVTGISQDGELSAVHASLSAAGLPLDRLQVITPDDEVEAFADRLVDPGYITGDRGNDVPGLTSAGHSVQFFRNEALDDRLGDLGIPESELDNYVDAVERGKTIIAYFARPETIDKAEESFKAASLANVRTY